MKVDGQHYRTVWHTDEGMVELIDQRWLPHEFVIERIDSVEQMAEAIRDMHIRGAGAIGAAAGYGMYLCVSEATGDNPWPEIDRGAELLRTSRPTAANLFYAVDKQYDALQNAAHDSLSTTALRTAKAIADEDAAFCKRIGEHGLSLIREISLQKKSGEPVNILTHCNAGWLAFVDHGTATAPVYEAYDNGIDIHVWVDETRPRNQGSRLTAWELGQHGVSHTVIADNTGGHLMQHGMVDAVIVGSDRTTYTGYVANKIGTYLKALAARDNGIPFYAALPSSTIDWNIRDGIHGIPIEERGSDELRYATGLLNGKVNRVLVAPPESNAANYAFDVTPPRLIDGIITERGIVMPDEDSILALYPEKKK